MARNFDSVDDSVLPSAAYLTQKRASIQMPTEPLTGRYGQARPYKNRRIVLARRRGAMAVEPAQYHYPLVQEEGGGTTTAAAQSDHTLLYVGGAVAAFLAFCLIKKTK